MEQSRRKFVKATLLGALASVVVASKPDLLNADKEVNDSELRNERRKGGRQIRNKAAKRDYRLAVTHKNNGDEKKLGVISSYTKGLRHNSSGEASDKIYARYLKILETKKFEEFDNLEIGIRPLKNPQAAMAYGLEGVDSTGVTIPPAPSFSSKELAGEMLEVYWMSMLRDVNFQDYQANGMVEVACQELTNQNYKLFPKQSGAVTPATIFRGQTTSDLIGPFISQFLINDIKMGSLILQQKQRTTVADDDYVNDYSEWLTIQNGNFRKILPNFDPTRRYIRNGRDLAWYVYNDRAFQPFFNAAATLVDANLINGTLLEARFNKGNPYKRLTSTEGFVTFGESHIFHLLAQASWAALKACWYQKWYVHRMLRPEEFGGRVHQKMTGGKDYDIHNSLLNSIALDSVFAKNGNYLLPQAYIEGSPMHPSYPSGHATIAGACGTILKAFFDEDYRFQDPKIPNELGTELLDYSGPDVARMTLGTEINKLSSNIGIGRDFAGVHYRSDYWYGMLLGESVAIRLLRQLSNVFVEKHSFRFSTFEGDKVVIN